MEETRQNMAIFSTSEMLYLVGSLGLPYNLMLGDPYRSFTREALKGEIEIGRQKLVESGMLKKVGFKEWELDARIPSMFEIAVSSPSSLFITVITKPAMINQYVYYYRDNQGISITLEGRLYHIGIYHDEQTLINFLMPILGISQQLSQGFAEFSFPGENFIGTLLACWKNPGESSQILQTGGLQVGQAENTARALQQAQIASILVLQPKPASPINKRRAYLIASRPSLWWSEIYDDQVGSLIFQPLGHSPTVLTRTAYDEEFTITYDPSKPNAIGCVLSFLRGESANAATDAGRQEEVLD